MPAQRNPEPPSAGASDGASTERPLNVLLSLASEPSAAEDLLPGADELLRSTEPSSRTASVLLVPDSVQSPGGDQAEAVPSARDGLPALAVPPETTAFPETPGSAAGAQPGAALQAGGGLDRLARWWFSPRVMELIALGLALLLLALIGSSWSSSAAGVLYPDWGLASLRIGIAAAILGTALLLWYLVIWSARARPMPIYAGFLGLLLVCVGASGTLSAASLHRLQGLWLEGRGRYGLALAAYQASGDSLAQSQALARITIEWAEQLSAQHDYGAAVAQIAPVIRLYKGDAALTERAQTDLIGDYLAWGDQARQQSAFRDALAHYQALQAAAYCAASCQAQVHAHTAPALLGLARQLAARQQYDQAVSAYEQLVQSYGDTPEAQEANLALTTPQMLTGHLVYANKTPAKNFQVLLASQWTFNPTSQVFTLLGQRYQAQTDASGLFVLPSVAVGATYMIAWIDPGGHAGTCYTTNDKPLYTVSMQPLRAADAGNINIECA